MKVIIRALVSYEVDDEWANKSFSERGDSPQEACNKIQNGLKEMFLDDLNDDGIIQNLIIEPSVELQDQEGATICTSQNQP